MKRILALTLAAIMLLMPMTASAVTWSQITTALYAPGTSFSGGGTTATREGDTYTITGGTVDWSHFDSESNSFSIDYIDQAGNYIFKGVTFIGPSMPIDPLDNQKITVSLDKDTVFNTSDYGLDIYATRGAEVTVHNDATIVGRLDSLFIYIRHSQSKVTVDGSGTVKYSYNADAEQDGFGYEPLFITLLNGASLDQVSIDQKYVTYDGMVAQINIRPEITEGEQDEMHFYVDKDGNVYAPDGETGELELIGRIELEAEEEEPEEERDPIEELRQAQAIGGVTTSPVWNWQGYLGHSSKPMWIYVGGEKQTMLQRLYWHTTGKNPTKNHTCLINEKDVDPAELELRIGLDMLRTAERAGIAVITILDSYKNPIVQFSVADMLAAWEMYSLGEDELLCLSGDANAEVTKITAEGERVPIEGETAE